MLIKDVFGGRGSTCAPFKIQTRFPIFPQFMTCRILEIIYMVIFLEKRLALNKNKHFDSSEPLIVVATSKLFNSKISYLPGSTPSWRTYHLCRAAPLTFLPAVGQLGSELGCSPLSLTPAVVVVSSLAR